MQRHGSDSIRTERAFLKMSVVHQEVLMGLREDACAPLLAKKHGPGLDFTSKILAQPASSLESYLDSSQWGFLIVPAEMC